MHRSIAEHLASVGLDEYQALRNQMLDVLTDDDLTTAFGGATPTLGALCREIGEVEHAYVESFRTFAMNFDFRQTDPHAETSVETLRAWYAALDRDLLAALDGLTDADVDRHIVRSDFDPSYFSPRPLAQLNNYREALLIFYGKSSIYLQALDKDLSTQWRTWIA